MLTCSLPLFDSTSEDEAGRARKTCATPNKSSCDNSANSKRRRPKREVDDGQHKDSVEASAAWKTEGRAERVKPRGGQA